MRLVNFGNQALGGELLRYHPVPSLIPQPGIQVLGPMVLVLDPGSVILGHRILGSCSRIPILGYGIQVQIP